MKTIYYVILLVLLTLMGCRKDSESETTTTTETPGPVIVGYQPDVERVNAAVEGFIHDHLDQPLENAKVTFGNNSVQTDAYGYFKLSSTLLNKYGEPVIVEHPGYFDVNYRLYPTNNSNNWLKVKLTQKNYNQISGWQGGIVTFAGGGTLQIYPNSLLTSADTVHQGGIDVAISYIDVNQPGELYSTAGNHFGIDNRLDEVILNSYGIVAIEVLTTSGDPLKVIDEDSLKPRLIMPSSPALLGNLPAFLPHWDFYEPYSAWVETGTASYNSNGYYSTKLSYLNYVNLGIPNAASYFDAQVLGFNNIPHTNSIVHIVFDSISLGHDIIDDDGFVSGYYPENRNFEFTVSDLCDVQYSGSFTPMSGPQSLGSIIIPINHTQIVADVQCNGSPINSFFVNLNDGLSNNYYRVTSNDTITIPACQSNPNSLITIIDPGSQTNSNGIPINPGSFNNLGIIDLCNTGPSDYIQFDYDSTFNYFLPSPTVDTAGGITKIYLTPGCFEFYGNTVGNYSGQGSNFLIYDPPGLALIGALDSLFVTIYSNTNIVGTFQGTVTDTVSQQSIFIDGDFDIDL